MTLLLTLIVLTAGDTRLAISPDPVRVGLERGGAVVAAAHLESGLLLGNPVRPEAASVHSSGWRFHFDHSRACHRMEERDRPKFVEPHLFGRVAAPRFRVPDPSRGGL